MNTYAFVTERTPERPWSLLDKRGGVWVSSDPVSTHELISTTFDWKAKQLSHATTSAKDVLKVEMSTLVDLIVETYSDVYGKYATLSSATRLAAEKARSPAQHNSDCLALRDLDANDLSTAAGVVFHAFLGLRLNDVRFACVEVVDALVASQDLERAKIYLGWAREPALNTLDELGAEVGRSLRAAAALCGAASAVPARREELQLHDRAQPAEAVDVAPQLARYRYEDSLYNNAGATRYHDVRELAAATHLRLQMQRFLRGLRTLIYIFYI
ncbi:MAG: hypothetical protein SGPRY_010464 [Prymnesium sp.]